MTGPLSPRPGNSGVGRLITGVLVFVGVCVGVNVAVGVKVAVGVCVLVAVAVLDAVWVGVAVAVGSGVFVGYGVRVFVGRPKLKSVDDSATLLTNAAPLEPMFDTSELLRLITPALGIATGT
jgi:hypothetical protein